MRPELIQQALGDGAGDGADAQSVAVSTIRALRSLHAELEPLVGVEAVRALHARALHLTRPSFIWLIAAPAETRSESLPGLQEALAAHGAQDARGAGTALLHNFADLLISLIGEPLTHRLLRSAWQIQPAAASSQEPKP